MTSAQPKSSPSPPPPKRSRLPSGLSTPGNVCRPRSNNAAQRRMWIRSLGLRAALASPCTIHPEQGQTGQRVAMAALLSPPASLESAGEEPGYAGHLLFPYLCLFCWGRFSGSIYILLGLGSLRQDERSIWIQSHLQRRGENEQVREGGSG